MLEPALELLQPVLEVAIPPVPDRFLRPAWTVLVAISTSWFPAWLAVASVSLKRRVVSTFIHIAFLLYIDGLDICLERDVTASQRCKNFNDALLYVTAQIALVSPYETGPGQRDLQWLLDGALCLCSNSLTALAMNLFCGYGFRANLRYLKPDDAVTSDSVLWLSVALFFLARGVHLLVLLDASYLVKTPEHPLPRLKEHYDSADSELIPLTIICLLYACAAPLVCDTESTTH